MGILDEDFRDSLSSSLNYQSVPLDRPSRPTGETWQQAGMTQYKGYYYEIANSLVGLGMGSNWAYSLYPPSAASTAFFNYRQVIRLQDGFQTRSAANTAVKLWIDGLTSGTVDSTDTGSADLFDTGLDPLPFISETVSPNVEVIPDTNPVTQESETVSKPMSEDQRFMLIGFVVLAGLYGLVKR